MDQLMLPPEILIDIFKYLSAKDIKAVCETCNIWKNIVENYDIWKHIWLHLLRTTSETNLKNNLYISLKKTKLDELNLKLSCIRLQNILFDRNNKIHKCLLDSSVRTRNLGILITHYSKIKVLFTDNYNYAPRNNGNYMTVRNNDLDPTSESYMLFRQPPKLLETLKTAFKKQGHVRKLVWIYPMGVTEWLEQVSACLLETAHIERIVRIPRVVALCDNLEISDAVVVVSGGRSTEVAIIVNGRVGDNRWAERPVGGWRIAQNLNYAYTWLHPGEHNPCIFETPCIKAQCWVPQNLTQRCQPKQQSVHIGDNKDELYLSAELMYSELNLVEMVETLSVGLSFDEMSRCLSHVLLAGGNCRLKHFSTRLRLDFLAKWPKHADSINVSVHTIPALLYTPPRSPQQFTVITQHDYVCAK